MGIKNQGQRGRQTESSSDGNKEGNLHSFGVKRCKAPKNGELKKKLWNIFISIPWNCLLGTGATTQWESPPHLLAMQVVPPAASPVRIGTDPCWTSYESVYWARPPPNQCGLHIFQALCFARGKNTQYRDFLPVKPFMLTAIRDAFRVYQSAVFHICAGQSIAASVNTMLTARVLLAAKLQPRRGGDPVG